MYWEWITVEYKVSIYGQLREYAVTYNLFDETVMCNCMKYEFMGVLCSHALKVLDYRNIKLLPSHCILKRWTRDARVWNTRHVFRFTALEWPLVGLWELIIRSPISFWKDVTRGCCNCWSISVSCTEILVWSIMQKTQFNAFGSQCCLTIFFCPQKLRCDTS